MHATNLTLTLPLGTLTAFLLVLARVAGLIAFLPLGAWRSAPAPVRAGLALALTLALCPVWPALPNAIPSATELAAAAFAEAGVGVCTALAVSLLMEGFQIAMQVVGLQAGYGYALTIDPNSQADANVLQIVFTLATGWLLLALGFDRELIRLLAASFERFPAGAWAPSEAGLEAILSLGGSMLVTGLRWALPLTSLLLLIDLSLALLGRMQQQLQLLSLAFPVKMLAGLGILAAMAPMLPRLFASAAERSLAALARLLG
jgi:flagellar biosynthetic protein FliR